MYCTKCGIQLKEQDKFCNECGTPTGTGPAFAFRTDQLTRPVVGAKLAGVCAGFARYFALDVTLVRIVWCVLAVWPIPLLGVIGYIVAMIVMPKDPVTLPASAPFQSPNVTAS